VDYDAEVAHVLVQRVRLERTRQLGPCLAGWALWRALRLDEFFEARVDDAKADVPWSRIAAVLAINRLCAPGSELAIEERWYPTTALDDLLHIPDGAINDSRLYRALDHLLPHKTALERHLATRYGELFAAEFDVLLYDLTSSYVEGAAPKDPMLRRGYSRDHRRAFPARFSRRSGSSSRPSPSWSFVAQPLAATTSPSPFFRSPSSARLPPRSLSPNHCRICGSM